MRLCFDSSLFSSVKGVRLIVNSMLILALPNVVILKVIIPVFPTRLSKLKILEVRENHLKTLPKSVARLTALERLDIGNNEFTELVSNYLGSSNIQCVH